MQVLAQTLLFSSPKRTYLVWYLVVFVSLLSPLLGLARRDFFFVVLWLRQEGRNRGLSLLEV